MQLIVSKETSVLIRTGYKILALSFNAMHAERLKNTHSPSNKLRTAWPEMQYVFSDLVQGKPRKQRLTYTAAVTQQANKVCDIYSTLPYRGWEKKMCLVKAMDNPTWKELAEEYKIPWQEARHTSDVIILHMAQLASVIPKQK